MLLLKARSICIYRHNFPLDWIVRELSLCLLTADTCWGGINCNWILLKNTLAETWSCYLTLAVSRHYTESNLLFMCYLPLDHLFVCVNCTRVFTSSVWLFVQMRHLQQTVCWPQIWFEELFDEIISHDFFCWLFNQIW